VCREIFLEVSRSAYEFDRYSKAICEVRYVELRQKNGLFFKFPADVQFVCGDVPMTAAVLRGTVKYTPCIKVQSGFSHVETRVKY
jgi:hypothetical protein